LDSEEENLGEYLQNMAFAKRESFIKKIVWHQSVEPNLGVW
jgi:hypothetical protein